MTQLKKADLIAILINEYGYEKEDLKFDSNGNPYTNAKLKMLIEAEIEDAKELEESSSKVITQSKAFKDEDRISVMCGSSDTVIYRSDNSRKVWRFTKFGQKDSMPYGELITMLNSYPRYFQSGWIIILNKDVQEEFGLTDLYKNILTPDNIDEIFNLPIDELSHVIDNLPDGMKNTFINKAQDMLEAKELNSLEVVDLIESKFKFSLRDNSPIDDFALRSDLGRQNIIYVDKR